jgi:alanine dehydrogenase
VKETLPEEFDLLSAKHILFGYLHPCPRPDMVQAFARSRCTAITYEEVIENGRRPLLTPMSQIAGAGAVLLAGQFIQTPNGGLGKLLFATDATEPMRFTILGGGAAGRAAARSALDAGAEVTLFEANAGFVPQLRTQYPNAKVELWSTERFTEVLPSTDVLINCTMWMAGDPHLLTRPMLKLMRPGSLIMDVSADDHGAIETSVTTTHDDPIRVVDGILHYCTQNIPALFARSASQALSAATYPYLEQIVTLGVAGALRMSESLRKATVAYDGRLFGEDLARIQAIPTTPHDELLKLSS